MNLVQVKFRMPNNKTRTVWANKLRASWYQVLAKNGDLKNELVLTCDEDIISEEPARINRKYCEMEIDCCFERREFDECRCAFKAKVAIAKAKGE